MPYHDESAADPSEGSTVTHSETSSLLGAKTPVDDGPGDIHKYGSIERDDPEVGAETTVTSDGRKYSNAFIARTVVALLIGKTATHRARPEHSVQAMFLLISVPSGTFTTNADGSLVLATHPVIGSEFHDLENSSWLFIGFMLAGLATQSLVTIRFALFTSRDRG